MNDSIRFDFDDVFNVDDYLYFYQSSLTPERLNAELNFLVKYTQLDSALEILDLACGHGRHANALAVQGQHVTGIDRYSGFLKIAQQDALSLGVQVNYRQGDMRELDYKSAFDRVFVLFTAIGYFSDEQNEDVFKKIYTALKPGGIFCFDSHNRDVFLTYYKPTVTVEIGNDKMVDKVGFDTLTGRCHTQRTLVRNGVSKQSEYSVRFYNPTELTALLGGAGFTSVKFYSEWRGEPLSSSSKRMVVVAQK